MRYKISEVEIVIQAEDELLHFEVVGYVNVVGIRRIRLLAIFHWCIKVMIILRHQRPVLIDHVEISDSSDSQVHRWFKFLAVIRCDISVHTTFMIICCAAREAVLRDTCRPVSDDVVVIPNANGKLRTKVGSRSEEYAVDEV